jgi:hypothetical protein
MGLERWFLRHRLLTLTLMAVVPGGVVLWILLPWLERRR